MRNLHRKFQVTIALTLCVGGVAWLYTHFPVPTTYGIVLGIAAAGWKLSDEIFAFFEKGKPAPAKTNFSKEYLTALYHNKIISMEEYDLAMTRIEEQEKCSQQS